MSQVSESSTPEDSLSEQIPRAGFPSGVAVPSILMLVALLLVSAFGWVRLTSSPPQEVPSAVVDVQQDLTEDLALGMTSSASGVLESLATAASVPRSTAVGDVIHELVHSDKGWHGATLLDPVTGRSVGSAGAPLPLAGSALHGVTEPKLFPVRASGDSVEVVAAVPVNAPVSGSLVLAASASIDLPTVADSGPAAKSVVVVENGAPAAVAGVPRGAELARFARTVQREQDVAAQPGSVVGQPRPQTVAAGAGGAARQELAPVVTHAPVFDDDTGTRSGMALALVGDAELQPTDAEGTGPIIVFSLVALAVAGFVVTWLIVVRPLRRLRADALRLARGDLDAQPYRSRVWEAARLSAVLESTRQRLRGVRGAVRPTGAAGPVNAASAVLTVTIVLVTWAAAVVLTSDKESVIVPEQLHADASARTERTADQVRVSMNRGVGDLTVLANLTAERPEARTDASQRLLDSTDRYRSVYEVDRDGTVTGSVGDSPMLSLDRAPTGSGVRQGNTSGTVPLVYAHVPVPGGDGALIAEFDALHISTLADGALGRTRVVDDGMRVISDTNGYFAFAELSGGSTRSVVERAQGGTSGLMRGSGMDARLLTAAAVSGPGPASELGWTVVDDKPISEFTLPSTEEHRTELAIALLVGVIALLVGGWQYFVLVRPLHRLGCRGEEMLAEPRDTVLYAERHDECGAVARCLELCRQRMVAEPDPAPAPERHYELVESVEVRRELVSAGNGHR